MYCLVLPWDILKWIRFLLTLVVSVDSVETPGMLLWHCTLLIWFHLSNWYPAAKCDHNISVMFILMITKSLIRWSNKFLILFHVNQIHCFLTDFMRYHGLCCGIDTHAFETPVLASSWSQQKRVFFIGWGEGAHIVRISHSSAFGEKPKRHSNIVLQIQSSFCPS